MDNATIIEEELALCITKDFNRIEFLDENRNKLNKEELEKAKMDFRKCYDIDEKEIIDVKYIKHVQKFVEKKNDCLCYKVFDVKNEEDYETILDKIKKNYPAFVIVGITDDDKAFKIDMKFFDLALGRKAFMRYYLLEGEGNKVRIVIFF